MKSLLKFGLIALALSLLTACFSIPLGDGEKLKLSKDGISVENEDGEGTSINFDSKEGSFNVKSNKEGEEFDMSFGVDLEIPDDFPKHIPIPNDAVITAVTKDEKGTAVVLASNVPYEELKQVYMNYVKATYPEYEFSSDHYNPEEADEVVRKIYESTENIVANNDEYTFVASIINNAEKDNTDNDETPTTLVTLHYRIEANND